MQLPVSLQRCDVELSGDLDPGRSITVIPQTHDGVLNDNELVDYREQRKYFLSWLLNVGKNPKKGEGYSEYTLYSTAYRTARFDLWTWEQNDQYRYPLSYDDAETFLEHLAYSDTGRVERGKLQEGIQHFGKWRHHQHGDDPWEFDFSFDGSGKNNQPSDFLTKEERRKIRQAALNHGDWKITSLVWVSLDAGLRPDEVSNVKPGWIDTDNAVLRVPKAESSKNEGNWTVPLTERTAMSVSRWKDIRDYDSDLLWETRNGNPYGSQSLGRLLKKLCNVAGISTENRSMSWYSIRHSVGTHMTEERDLAATQAQLRHKNPQTTMKYDGVPVEERRDALDNME